MFKEIRIRNFKSFSDTPVAFAPFTILLGENGAGKSTVIQTLLLTQQSTEVEDGEAAILLNGHLIRLGLGRDVLRQGADEESIVLSYALTSGNSVILDIQYDAESDELPAQLIGDLYEIQGEQFSYLHAERIGPRLHTTRDLSEADAGEMESDGDGALAVLERHRADILEPSDPRRFGESGSLEELFQFHLAKISPGARIELIPYAEMDAIGATFSYTAPAGVPGARIRPTNVGFGLSFAAPIIVACLVASEGSVLVVENPEAHLHTSGQRSLFDLLAATAEAGIQVIVETHSREFFHRARTWVGQRKEREDLVAINFFEGAFDDVGARLTKVHTLRPANGSLADWPACFFDAYGSPTDLIAPVN